jgi:hypothetical protein
LTTTAVVPSTLSEADITAALRKHGLLEPEAPATGINRVTMNGLMFTFDDGTVATSNPKTGAPAFLARLLDTPVEYQAAWLTEPLARAIGRPEDANRFCKSHFDVESEARKYSESGADCNKCPIGPFVPKDSIPLEADGRKCQWKADLSFQVVTPEFTIDDPKVHTLTLSTTSIIEFKGVAKNPVAGSASDFNFMQKLARFGMASDPENPTRGLANALTALRLGGVIVEVRAIPTWNADRSRSWSVASFTPVRIIDVAAADSPALPEVTGVSADDLPF